MKVKLKTLGSGGVNIVDRKAASDCFMRAA
jgi:hypothetical protein